MNSRCRTIKFDCPTCKKGIEYTDEYPFRPFCSERCKLIDLGEWAAEGHKIKGSPLYEDILSEDLQEPDSDS